MTKPFEIIYSRQKTNFREGVAYANPRFFSTPREGVAKVILVGDWPKIEAAYKARGVPVERLAEDAEQVVAPPVVPSAAPASLTPVAPADERGRIYIPEDWRDLPWTQPKADRDLTLRGLAALFSATPVINKAQAVAAVTAELQRRAEADVASNGLTRSEISADLMAIEADFDPRAPVEELLALRDGLRAERDA